MSTSGYLFVAYAFGLGTILGYGVWTVMRLKA